MPASSVGTAAESSCRVPRSGARVWASAAAANIPNETAPASAWDRSCSVPARKLGASEVTRPNNANAIAAPIPAAKKRRRAYRGTVTRCGRYRGRGESRTRVSGTINMPMTASARVAIRTTNGTISGWPTHCARAPAIRPPRPSPPRLAATATIRARSGLAPARSGSCNSASHAVAVAVTAPIPSPLMTRPTTRPGSWGQSTRTTPARMLSTSAGTSTRLRPCQSERCPTKNRLAATATA